MCENICCIWMLHTFIHSNYWEWANTRNVCTLLWVISFLMSSSFGMVLHLATSYLFAFFLSRPRSTTHRHHAQGDKPNPTPREVTASKAGLMFEKNWHFDQILFGNSKGGCVLKIIFGVFCRKKNRVVDTLKSEECGWSLVHPVKFIVQFHSKNIFLFNFFGQTDEEENSVLIAFGHFAIHTNIKICKIITGFRR